MKETIEKSGDKNLYFSILNQMNNHAFESTDQNEEMSQSNQDLLISSKMILKQNNFQFFQIHPFSTCVILLFCQINIIASHRFILE